MLLSLVDSQSAVHSRFDFDPASL